ncbi:MAG TPA: hypothetical protein VFV73_09200 [Streptosporangiaceae bacterium]|nr:hypothetical protein [Streptosporangiaceae bacterium]
MSEVDEAARLAVTVVQLEHALAARSGSSRPSACWPNGTGTGPSRSLQVIIHMLWITMG